MSLYRLLERIHFRHIVARLYRVSLSGRERIPASGPAILVANHESLFDPWLLALATPRPVRYMAKAELWRFRLVGAALSAFGAFPVERGVGDTGAMSQAAELLRQGELLGIFPQGTSKRRAKRAYRSGAARLALETGAPLVPVTLCGTRGVPLPWRRHRTLIAVGNPIVVQQATPTGGAARALTAQLEEQIAEVAR